MRKITVDEIKNWKGSRTEAPDGYDIPEILGEFLSDTPEFCDTLRHTFQAVVLTSGMHGDDVPQSLMNAIGSIWATGFQMGRLIEYDRREAEELEKLHGQKD